MLLFWPTPTTPSTPKCRPTLPTPKFYGPTPKFQPTPPTSPTPKFYGPTLLTPRTHARHPRYLADSSGSWHRCFAVNIAKFLRTLFYGTPPVTASGKNSKISVPAVFDCTWYHGLPLHCDKIAVKHDVKRKIFMLESIHTTIQTSKHLNKIKMQFCNDMYSTAEASLHSQSR